jgi:probable addiction module antidote protein
MHKTIAYKDWLSAKLSDPQRAARYLNAAYQDSTPAFLKALRKVSESLEKKQLAESAGVSRESLYRMLSETGNPTLTSLRGITEAMGFRLEIVPISSTSQPQNSEPLVKHRE